ncbi:MAG: hypothetical protein D6808_01720, partial [Candidatus Dadabacteria bacterium]
SVYTNNTMLSVLRIVYWYPYLFSQVSILQMGVTMKIAFTRSSPAPFKRQNLVDLLWSAGILPAHPPLQTKSLRSIGHSAGSLLKKVTPYLFGAMANFLI